MNLTPENARRLADVLFDSDPGVERDAATPLGRLSPGAFGRYRITRLLGVGGMGEVYEAEQESPARKVAIKVVRPDLLSGEVLRRFEHETRILGRLQHPGIAPIYEAGQVQTAAGSTPFFAMEFVDGKPLTGFAHDAHMPVRERLELFLKVCDAVEHAHRNGVIHRDLKPGNILVDATGRPRVMDFGVARATDSDIRATTLHTEVGRLVGTLPYMSPEQVGGDPDALDTRSDVYSLGVVLYELLGGKLPYDLKGDGQGRIPEAVRAIQEREPSPLSSVDKMFRGDLDTIVAKALAKERGHRYQSVGELAADIRRYLADEPIVARRPSAWYQVRKFARRNRTLVAALVALTVVLSVSSVVSVGFAVKARLSATHALRQTHVLTQVRTLLQRIIVSASPKKLGRTATVVEAVHSAADEIDASHPDDDFTEAAMRNSIGYALLQLGDLAGALHQLERAHDLANRPGVNGTDEEAEIDLHLANALCELDRYAECEPLWPRVVQLKKSVFGEESKEAVNAQADYGEFLLERGEREEAEHVLHEVLERATSLPEDAKPDIVAIRFNLAAALALDGRYDEALPIMQELAGSDRKRLGENHPDSLASAQLLAVTLLQAGQAAAAEPLLVDLIDRDEHVYGADHALTLKDRKSLAGARYELGRPAEAEVILRDVLPRMKQVLGENHQEFVDTSHVLAMCLLEQNKHAEALALARDILGRLTGEELTSRLDRANFQQVQAQALLLEGHAAEAEPFAVAAWQTITGLHVKPGKQTTRTLRTLIDVENALGKAPEAERYRQELAARESRPRR